MKIKNKVCIQTTFLTCYYACIKKEEFLMEDYFNTFLGDWCGHSVCSILKSSLRGTPKAEGAGEKLPPLPSNSFETMSTQGYDNAL